MDNNTLINHSDLSFKEESVEFKTTFKDKRCPVCKRNIYLKDNDYRVFSMNDLIQEVNKSRTKIFKSNSLLSKAGNIISNVSDPFQFLSIKEQIKKDSDRVTKYYNLSLPILDLPIFHGCLGCNKAWLIHEVLSRRMNNTDSKFSRSLLDNIFFWKHENNLCSGVVFLRPPKTSSFNILNGNWGLYLNKLAAPEKLNEAKDAIIKGKIKSCIEILKSIDKSALGAYRDNIEMISSRFFALKKKNISGILSNENYTLEQNKITQDLITLINLIEKKLSNHNFNY